jgi:hypothetical protein
MLLEVRRDGHRFAGQQCRHPFGSPSALALFINACERLQSHGLVNVPGECPAEIVPVAPHGERGRTDRTAKIEGEDPGSRVPPELQRHQSQKDTLAGTRRTDDQSVADIANVERKAKRRGPFRPCKEERWTIEMLLPFRPSPDR